MNAPSPRPALSVIIPAFDAQSTLADQLAALSRQAPPFAWEVLVCDNGSRDGTAALARSWTDRLPELRVVDASARRGPSAARNIGAEMALSPLLAFCDADDVVADDWVERMAAALARSAVVAGSLEPMRLASPGATSVSWHVDSVIVKHFWPRFLADPSSNLGIRAEVFGALGGFDLSLAASEDIDLCWRAQLAGESFERADDVVVHLRKRVGLAPVYRQGYLYAVGDLHLQHKYADYIALDRGKEAELSAAARSGLTPPATVAPGSPSRRSPVARLLRLVRPEGRADAAYRLGHWMGTRYGRVDESTPRLTPDSN
jgi:glycosyltransferase involved in cell wall biosynthesis